MEKISLFICATLFLFQSFAQDAVPLKHHIGLSVASGLNIRHYPSSLSGKELNRNEKTGYNYSLGVTYSYSINAKLSMVFPIAYNRMTFKYNTVITLNTGEDWCATGRMMPAAKILTGNFIDLPVSVQYVFGNKKFRPSFIAGIGPSVFWEGKEVYKTGEEHNYTIRSSSKEFHPSLVANLGVGVSSAFRKKYGYQLMVNAGYKPGSGSFDLPKYYSLGLGLTVFIN